MDWFLVQVLDAKGAKYVVETMWMLMEANLEEVRKYTEIKPPVFYFHML